MLYLQGERRGRLQAVEPYLFHGVPHWRVVYSFTDGTLPPEERVEARLAAEQIYAEPRLGDEVRLRFLMNILERIEKA